MNIKKALFPSLLVCTALALTPRLFARPASAKRGQERQLLAHPFPFLQDRVQIVVVADGHVRFEFDDVSLDGLEAARSTD